jgi:hypothetical protein
LRAFPQLGRSVVCGGGDAHDGRVTSTAHLPAGSRRGTDASIRTFLVTDLERFWPSRRGHAFDELCRS